MRKGVNTGAFVIIALVTLTLLTVSVHARAEMVTAEAQGSSALQEWFATNGFAINVTEDELGIETFNAGYYQISILAEIAGHASSNNLSWYPTSSGQLHLIFSGANSTGDTIVLEATETFGLCLGTPNGSSANETKNQLFYTETNRNPDAFNHALVYLNPNPLGGYIIAWEDLWEGGDKDFQDMILAMYAQVDIDIKPHSYPNSINIKNKGVIPVAVFGTETFNVTSINASTVFFGSTGTEAQVHIRPNGKYHYGFEDINNDGYLDMVFHFQTQDCGFNMGDTEGMLTGKTYSGVSIMGSDSTWIHA